MIKELYDKNDDRDKILKTKPTNSKQDKDEKNGRKSTDARNRASIFEDPRKSLLFHKHELNKLHAMEN